MQAKSFNCVNILSWQWRRTPIVLPLSYVGLWDSFTARSLTVSGGTTHSHKQCGPLRDLYTDLFFSHSIESQERPSEVGSRVKLCPFLSISHRAQFFFGGVEEGCGGKVGGGKGAAVSIKSLEKFVCQGGGTERRLHF